MVDFLFEFWIDLLNMFATSSLCSGIIELLFCFAIFKIFWSLADFS